MRVEQYSTVLYSTVLDVSATKILRFVGGGSRDGEARREGRGT